MFLPLPLFVGLRYSWARENSFFVSFITWVSLAGVAVGVAALITILSVMNGFESELRTRLLSLSAHATLQSRGAPIANWREQVREVMRNAHVRGAAPYLEIDAMLTHHPAMSGAVVRGIDAELEAKVSSIGENMREGSLASLQPGSMRIVLGRMLAYQLEAGLGDHVSVMIPARGAHDEVVPRLRDFEVAGIFEVGLQEHDSVLALVSLEDAQSLKGIAGPTGIRLRFDDILRAPVIVRALHSNLEARDWTEDNAAYFRAIRIEKGMMGLILLLIVAVAVFNIVAALVMVVTDKRTDIAILRTLGLSPRGVLAIFTAQGLLIGWLGTALGVLLGLALALNVDVIVPFLENLLHFHIMDPDVYYVSGIPSELHARDVCWITAAALVLTALATLYPAARAARTAPAEALRYQ